MHHTSALRPSLSFESQVLDEVSDAVTVFALDGTLRYLNRAARTIFRVPDAVGPGTNIFELDSAPPTWRVSVAEGLQRALADGSFRTERPGFRHDGSPLTTEVSYQPYRDPSGELAGCIFVARDISHQVLAEELLMRRAAQQEALAALSSTALHSGELGPLAREAVEAVVEVLGVDHASLGELDGLSHHTLAGAGPHALPPGLILDLSRFPAEVEALRGTEPVVVDDIAVIEGLALGPRGGCLAAVPVPLGDRVGVLAAHHAMPRALGATELAFLRAVANVLSTAAGRIWRDERARHDALHDPVTGLPNRVLFADRTAQAALRCDGDTGSTLAVLVLDIDRFKLLNEALGHRQGDRLLRLVGERLRREVPQPDTVARLGGDSFAVLVEDLDGPSGRAVRVAEQLVRSLAAPIDLDGAHYYLTASLGIALRGSDEPPDDLLRNAEAAMYRAKEQGGDRCEVFDWEVLTSAQRKLMIANDLREAASRGQLVLHYQPQVCLEAGTVTDVEALLRWDHPTLGMLAPGEFLGVAAESGNLVPIGRWVLRQALADLAQWCTRPEAARIGVAVNLSVQEVMSDGLVDAIAEALVATGADPERVTFEITETTAMDDPASVILILSRLRSLGVRIAIDDFGTGYSSMVHLRRLPLDILKIDREFTDGVATPGEDESIVRATLGLARALGLRTVAEGVETPEQAAALRALGCEAAQGWLYAKALPIEDLLTHLRASTGATARSARSA